MSKRRPICFIDMDGVLCDFVGAACDLFGRPDLPDNWPLGEYGMGKSLGCTEAEFWRKIESRPSFWENMPAYPWCEDLFGLVQSYGYSPYISTSPSLDPASASGKTAWIQKHIGRHFRDYFIGGKKAALATFDRPLIDDSDDKVDGFAHAGGIGIVFPRRWNSKHEFSGDPIAYVGRTLPKSDFYIYSEGQKNG